MPVELVYEIAVIVGVGLLVIVWSRKKFASQSPQEKRDQIVEGYKQELKTALATEQDPQRRMAIKSELLKQFNDELARNIFFEQEEIRAVLLELSKEG
jgi:hypothetical protein